MKEESRIKYSPDVDAIVVIVRNKKPSYGEEIAPGIIFHYSADDELVEVEVLDASDFLSAAMQEMVRSTKKALKRTQ